MPETIEERYLNLALINMGEAFRDYGNLRQRGQATIENGGFNPIIINLYRAIAALKGTTYLPSIGTFANVTEDAENVE